VVIKALGGGDCLQRRESTSGRGEVTASGVLGQGEEALVVEDGAGS